GMTTPTPDRDGTRHASGAAATRRVAPRTIALVGAECTGKTTLAVALADELAGLWLPEALREFCDREGRTPRPGEQVMLMREQMEREARALERAAREGVEWVICDSTPLVTALYSVMLFGDHSLLVEGVAHQRRHALTLLADTDLPWVADGIQRDGPQARDRFHGLLRGVLQAHGLAHETIAGDARERLASALRAVRTSV
ncbi:MAG TPA: ATP-binding protein, partial [Quisquiliibacterium sp.]|nr:ATP-binding protein [Quisquiliibacterium sp.]